jgi:hypothetical protein
MDLTVEEQKHVRMALRHLHARLGEWAHVAKVLHFARGTITDMNCGHAPVTASMAFRVARFLGAPIDELLTGKFTPPSTCPYCKQPMPEDEVLQ